MQAERKQWPILGALYTHNPFYLLSTFFVLYAIERAFQPGVSPYVNPWALMASLTGFTLLSAITAWVVVRFGKVWEDARTILLVLVLMFLAMSVSFDEILNLKKFEAVRLLGLGFCFSLLITEAIVRSLKIRFPAAFRLPFYLILGLFFTYPVFVSHELTGLGLVATRWRIALFPAVAGAVSLTLIPAIRKGSAYIDDNGTPWRWPWLPWTAFGFLALAVCARSYSLTISFDDATGALWQMHSIFGGYFLVPFLLAVLILLLEIGLVEKRPRLQQNVAFAAALLPLLAVPLRSGDPTYAGFLTAFIQTAGSPVFLTVCAVLAFSLFAWFRGVRTAESVVVAMLLAAAYVAPQKFAMREFHSPQWIPLAALALMQASLAVYRRRSLHAIAALFVATALLTTLTWRHDWLVYRRVIPFHVLLLGMIAISVTFRDRFARVLNAMAAVLLPITSLTTAMALHRAGLSPPVIATYFAAMTLTAIVHWYFTRSRWYLGAACLNAMGGSGAAGWDTILALQTNLGRGVFIPLAYGTLFFIVAVLISAHKAGAFNRWLPRSDEPPNGEAL